MGVNYRQAFAWFPAICLVSTPAVSPAQSARPIHARIAAGCAAKLPIVLDKKSFDQNGAGAKFSRLQLANFETKVSAALRAGFQRQCARDRSWRGKLANVRRINVISSSGSTEPELFNDETVGALGFGYFFAENDLEIPEDSEIDHALKCWRKPDLVGCEYND